MLDMRRWQTRREIGGFLLSVFVLALGIEGSSHDPKARRRGTIAPERPDLSFTLDNKKHKEYKKSMDTKNENLSVPQVAKKLNVHRNTVLYWISQGFIKATVKNALTSRPQYLISSHELQRIEKSQNVAPKPTA